MTPPIRGRSTRAQRWRSPARAWATRCWRDFATFSPPSSCATRSSSSEAWSLTPTSASWPPRRCIFASSSTTAARARLASPAAATPSRAWCSTSRGRRRTCSPRSSRESTAAGCRSPRHASHRSCASRASSACSPCSTRAPTRSSPPSAGTTRTTWSSSGRSSRSPSSSPPPRPSARARAPSSAPSRPRAPATAATPRCRRAGAR
mmetsp:Transcript_8745/g.22775  ORF Transcript_8745/g.22775 Transcript_8745/m.22775 type:complete len:205 (+) Transcript_8745:309-923(+)